MQPGGSRLAEVLAEVIDELNDIKQEEAKTKVIEAVHFDDLEEFLSWFEDD